LDKRRATTRATASKVISENETLRWPTNLDRAGIESRLLKVCESARSLGLAHLVSLYADLKSMSAAELGASVVAGLTWLQDQPAHRALAMQLEMVAMNLKNLK